MSDRDASDTIVAIATPAGRGAVGIVRLSGPDAFAIARPICGELPPPRRAALRVFRDAAGRTCDEGLVLRFESPHSYTGEHVVELQGHGGAVVLDLLLQAALAHGARMARPGEFSERAFLNDRLDLAQAEAVADLIDASSREAVLAARRTLDGALSREVADLDARLMDLRVFVEGALDFSDEDIDWLADDALAHKLDDTRTHLQQLLANAQQGRRLREGMTVAIAGRPNAGKSTLINALARSDAAIVSDRPGTTRDVLREHVLIDGMPLTLLDTAGLRDTDDAVESEGIRRAWQALEQAELVLFVCEDSESLQVADRALLERLPPALPRLLLLNKCDLASREPALLEIEGQPALRISARHGHGLSLLRAQLNRHAGRSGHEQGLFSARARHLDALRDTAAHLQAAADQLQAGQAAELAAEELRLAQQALGQINGRVSTEDLLGEVFSRFCIGK